MQITDFLSRLEKVEQSGGGWIACCPAHGDSIQSLSISESGGKILVHCHAGCSVSAIVEAMGLKIKDLFTGHRAMDGAAQDRPSAARPSGLKLKGESYDERWGKESMNAIIPIPMVVPLNAGGCCNGGATALFLYLVIAAVVMILSLIVWSIATRTDNDPDCTVGATISFCAGIAWPITLILAAGVLVVKTIRCFITN